MEAFLWSAIAEPVCAANRCATGVHFAANSRRQIRRDAILGPDGHWWSIRNPVAIPLHNWELRLAEPSIASPLGDRTDRIFAEYGRGLRLTA